jgi:hypothetical protein
LTIGRARALHANKKGNVGPKSCVKALVNLMLRRSCSTLLALAAFFLALPFASFGQRLSGGLMAGAGLTGDFQDGTTAYAGFTSAPEHYLAGAWLEIKLPASLALEIDALYRPLGFTWALVTPTGQQGFAHNSVITWELPLLAKYRIPMAVPALTPFVEAGPVLRGAGNLNGTNPSHTGIAAGLGFETQLGALKLAPAVRYIHWAADPPRGVPVTVRDQVELVVGIGASGERARQWFRRVSIGIALGGSLTPDYGSSSTLETLIANTGQVTGTITSSSGPRGVVGGPSVECELYHGLSVEADALARTWRQSSQTAFANPSLDSTLLHSVGTWEFPILAKYRLPVAARSFKPFLELGPSFRMRGDLSQASRYAIAAGAGVETHSRKLTIAPSVRYTRWAADAYPQGNNLGEVVALVGFSF